MSELLFKYQDRIVFCELISSYMQKNVIIGLPAQISMYKVPCIAFRSSRLSNSATSHKGAGRHTGTTETFCEALHWWFTPLLSSANDSDLCQLNEPKTVNVFYEMQWKQQLKMLWDNLSSRFSDFVIPLNKAGRQDLYITTAEGWGRDYHALFTLVECCQL